MKFFNMCVMNGSKRSMAVEIFIAILWIAPSILCLPQPRNHVYNNITFISREQWGGRPPVNIFDMNVPVPFVVIHHTHIPEACFTISACSAAMRSMQNYHQLELEWDDIGYHFAVGSDGAVYEGRGWDAVGGHTYGFNTRSIGIALIGDWISKLPPQVQLDATKNLIKEGVRLGYINERYGLIGHLQAGITECPGQALFQVISTWDRFQPNV